MSDAENPLARAHRLVREHRARIDGLEQVMASTDWRGLFAEEKAALAIIKGRRLALWVITHHRELVERDLSNRVIRGG